MATWFLLKSLWIRTFELLDIWERKLPDCESRSLRVYAGKNDRCFINVSAFHRTLGKLLAPNGSRETEFPGQLGTKDSELCKNIGAS
jgi:hypothetical protein